MTDSLLTSAHAVAARALAAVPVDAAVYAELTDDELLELARVTARQQRLVATSAALIAGEIDRRSAPELGSTGLAQRLGQRTSHELVRVTTGSTRRETAIAVSAGQLVVDPTSPSWLEPVRALLLQGRLSTAAVESIRNGLGEPTPDVTAVMLRDAAAEVSASAETLDPDRVYRLARDRRDALDEASVRDRESALRARRALRLRNLPDGGAHISWTLDPESAAVARELLDRATSPRRGGPRFTTADRSRDAQRIIDDERLTEQLASDVFLELLRQGADADASHLLQSGAPVVRVLTTASALAHRHGRGWFEGQSGAASVHTIERLACAGGTQSIVIDASGQPLDVGREKRLYSRRQRIALAARDGGCRWPGCERPPSWCEAHHIRHWARDRGSTDVAQGMLLCRHHHLLSHNNGWEIELRGSDYVLIPPAAVDSSQQPIVMPTKSSALTELLGAG